MELLPPIELDPHSLGDHPIDQRSARPQERLLGLCSWMMVLGTVRLVCMLADYVGAFAEAMRVEPFTMRMLSRVAEEIHPVVAISSAWPLILAIALRRTRWPQLVPAAAATFLVLSIGGMIELCGAMGPRARIRRHGGLISLDEACVPEPQRVRPRAGDSGSDPTSARARHRDPGDPAHPRAFAARRLTTSPDRSEPGGRATGVSPCTHRSDTFSSRSGCRSGPPTLRC